MIYDYEVWEEFGYRKIENVLGECSLGHSKLAFRTNSRAGADSWAKKRNNERKAGSGIYNVLTITPAEKAERLREELKEKKINSKEWVYLTETDSIWHNGKCIAEWCQADVVEMQKMINMLNKNNALASGLNTGMDA